MQICHWHKNHSFYVSNVPVSQSYISTKATLVCGHNVILPCLQTHIYVIVTTPNKGEDLGLHYKADLALGEELRTTIEVYVPGMNVCLSLQSRLKACVFRSPECDCHLLLRFQDLCRDSS